MCSQFEVDDTMDHVQIRFDLSAPPDFMPTPQVRPTNRVPVIKTGGQVDMLRWGLENSWDNKPLINARSETLAEKKSFNALLDNRCLIPATAYFEWRKDGKLKFKTRISAKDGGMIGFAGLYNDDRFTIITCAPSAAIAHIHGRMPVILDRELEEAWMSPRNDYDQVRDYLTPYPDGLLETEELTPPPKQPDLFG